MCGIVGVIGDLKGKTKVFSELLYADAFRGWDSTGVYGVTETKGGVEITADKRALPAPEFMATQMWRNFVKGVQYMDYVVGHNRKSTMGVTEDRTAHPFVHKEVILVHNGTLRGNWRHYLNAPTGTTVDSYALTHAIGESGIDNIIQLIDGAFTLVWYDREKEQFNLIRNDERPLGMLKIKGSGIIFASEIDMATWIAKRNSLEIEESWDLPVGELWTYTKGGTVVSTEKKELFVSKSMTYWDNYGPIVSYEDKHSKLQEAELGKLGYEKGDTVYFRLDDVQKNLSNEGRATVWGKPIRYPVRGPRFRTVAYYVDMDEIQQDNKQAIYAGDVERVDTYNKKDGPRVTLGNVGLFAHDGKEFREALLEMQVQYDSDKSCEGSLWRAMRGKFHTMSEILPFIKGGCKSCKKPLGEKEVEGFSITWHDNIPICQECEDSFQVSKVVTQ